MSQRYLVDYLQTKNALTTYLIAMVTYLNQYTKNSAQVISYPMM